MATCPHCGKDTTEPAALAGTIAAGQQAYRRRKQGARILPADNGPDNVGSDAA